MRGLTTGGLLALAVVICCSTALRGQEKEEAAEKKPPTAEQIREGRELFKRRWTQGDALSPDGDGLGPMHNARSCAACHFQGGLGGGGPLKNNVDVLAIMPPKTSAESSQFLSRMRTVHPGFLAGGQVQTHIIMHRFSTEKKYSALREYLLGKGGDVLREDEAANARKLSIEPITRREVHGVELIHVQRNSTSMFGAGLIDTITDHEIMQHGRHQAVRYPGVTGRLAPAGANGFGRFGWRAQAETLRDFVVGACAAELGLQTANDKQATNPQKPGERYEEVVDLSEEQVASLVAFVGSLPRPRQIKPTDPQEASKVQLGEKLFGKIGCTACHPRKLGKVDGLFSDLLLHDMGAMLSDPVPPQLPRELMLSISRTVESARNLPTTSGYYGANFAAIRFGRLMRANSALQQGFQSSQREYRTPPLWGARDSAPYMHDGRAATLTEAIALHGGEGQDSAAAFYALSGDERDSVLAFLRSLAAPLDAEPVERSGE